MQPNLVIFKIPSNDLSPLFAELTFFDKKLSENADVFTTNETDSYHDLNYNQIVLARIDTNGSIELGRFSIKGDKDEINPIIHSLKHNEIQEISTHLCSLI